eukprot:Phypoly_transcript_16652.p1 GENE.Phypoly_transcript_16652~~Phypoly_transcript_16652.p1  ORF type:complete len:247 (+),score=39.23 Phypoly_transcript_16652:76-816(+)
MTITVRKSEERNSGSHGWLNYHHTFTFGYGDKKFHGFNSLLIINEDRIAPSQGFGFHPHSEMEIFTYVVSGQLEHKDTMNNTERLQWGDVQFTSAGTGMRHSEYNASDTEWLHILQIWVDPNVHGIAPSYRTAHFSEEEKQGKLRLFVSPDGSEGSIPIHQDIKAYACILRKGESVTHTFEPGRGGYIHMVDTKGSASANGVLLQKGDGAFITYEHSVEFVGVGEFNEFVFFDVKSSRPHFTDEMK